MKKQPTFLTAIIACLFVAPPFSLFAQEELDSLMEGFEAPSTEIATDTSTPSSRTFNMGGYVSLSSSYNTQRQAPTNTIQTDFRGFSRLRLKLLPEFGYVPTNSLRSFVSFSAFHDLIFQLKESSNYQSDYIDSMENEAELREMWILSKLSPALDLKVGRQIVSWGKSDSLRVVDVLNPLDFREPGMVDLEDLRLPVSMIKLDSYFGKWQATFIAIPEYRSDKMPSFGSDYYPASSPSPPENRPTVDLEHPEYAVALSGLFSGFDLSFHYAQTYEDQGHMSGSFPKSIFRAYNKQELIGLAQNFSTGSFLIKTELAHITNISFFNTGNRAFSRNDLMIGLDYSGIQDHTISIETVVRKIESYDSILDNAPDFTEEVGGQTAIRVTGKYFRETAEVTALAMLFGQSAEEGGLYRGSVKFIPMDALSITAGAIVYQGGENQFLNALARNDRIFAELRYDY
ncbi:MAG: DUF1302 domain-containing protein [Gammaproteobacteria bacterium]|nr:DUF1302 domain-containing protein [Gammaproteobacteria bacterium]